MTSDHRTLPNRLDARQMLACPGNGGPSGFSPAGFSQIRLQVGMKMQEVLDLSTVKHSKTATEGKKNPGVGGVLREAGKKGSRQRVLWWCLAVMVVEIC